jgi:hypothetical protein
MMKNVITIGLVMAGFLLGVSSSQAKTLDFQCNQLPSGKPLTWSVDTDRHEVSWPETADYIGSLEQIENVSIDDSEISFHGMALHEFYQFLTEVNFNRVTGLLTAKIGNVYKNWKCVPGKPGND